MPTLLARGLPLHTARRRLLTAGPGAPAKPLTFLACAGHTASWAQPRRWALPAQGQGLPWGPPTHQLPQSFCSTVPGGKKLPPDSQGQEAGSKQTPPGITEGRTGADGTQRLLAPAMSPRPCGCLPRPSAAPPQILTLPTMQQSPLGAEAALHTGDSLAVPPWLRTMVMTGGGTHGATGLVHLAPFTLQSWVERREA